MHSDQEQLQRAAVARLDEIEELTSCKGHFLEVGFGSGHTLREAHRRGWKVMGTELTQSCVSAAATDGIPARCTGLPNYPGPDEDFDVVGIYNVIEHTHDPPAYLRRAHALLKPSGLLILRLPDTADNGPPASLLAHLFHFNQSTISTLLQRCDFDVVQFGQFFPWKPTKSAGELWSMNVVARRG